MPTSIEIIAGIIGPRPCRTRVLTSSQEFAFCVCHGFNHVFAVTRVEEELPTLGIGNEFNKIRIPTDG